MPNGIDFDAERDALPPGWRDLTNEMRNELDEIFPDWFLVQMREAHGGNLRVYIGMDRGWHNKRWYKAWETVENYEKLALKTCRECGSQDGVTTFVTDKREFMQLCNSHKRKMRWGK